MLTLGSEGGPVDARSMLDSCHPQPCSELSHRIESRVQENPFGPLRAIDTSSQASHCPCPHHWDAKIPPRLPVPLHTASPEHVLVAAFIAWVEFARFDSMRRASNMNTQVHIEPLLSDQDRDPLARSVFGHSDGMVPTTSQLCPVSHRHCVVPQLSLPSSRSVHQQTTGDDAVKSMPSAPKLARRLQSGVWCIANPAPFDHSAAALTPTSAVFHHAMNVIVPTIVEAAKKVKRAAAHRVPV